MRVFIALLLLIGSIGESFAAISSEDQKAINQVVRNYTYSWNYLAGRNFGEHFTEDGDFVNIFGMHFKGKAEIEERHIQILDGGFLNDSKLTITQVRFRELGPDTVVGHLKWKLKGFRNPGSDPYSEGRTTTGIFTQFFRKVGNQWLIEASHNVMDLERKLPAKL